MNSPLFSFLAALCLTGWAAAQEPAAQAAPAGPVRDVCIELLCVSLPQAQALPIVRQFRSGVPEDRAKALADLWQLVDKGSAKLIGWPRLLAHEGGKAEHAPRRRSATPRSLRRPAPPSSSGTTMEVSSTRPRKQSRRSPSPPPSIPAIPD